MPTTPLGAPYPGLTDPPNGPAQIQALAQWINDHAAGNNMGAPATTAANGTTTVGVETRDDVLGVYTFTAIAGRRYQAVLSGMSVSGSVLADQYALTVRNGGAATPGAASPAVASGRQYTAAAVSIMSSTHLSGTFVPGAGVQKLALFVLRVAGTGTGTPIGARELYAIDLGPA